MTAFEWRATGADAQRAVVIGKTGSGKTTLAVQLARSAARAVWIDVKGENDPGFVIVSAALFLDQFDGRARARLLARLLQEHQHITVQLANRPDVKDEAQVDAVCEAAFELRDLLVVLDDAMGVLSSSPPYYLNRILTMGRSHGVGFMGIVQRAHRIPLVLLTEAEHVIVFQLFGDSDVARLSTDVDAALEQARELERHQYLWYDREARMVQRFKPLRLQSPALRG